MAGLAWYIVGTGSGLLIAIIFEAIGLETKYKRSLRSFEEDVTRYHQMLLDHTKERSDLLQDIRRQFSARIEKWGREVEEDGKWEQ